MKHGSPPPTLAGVLLANLILDLDKIEDTTADHPWRQIRENMTIFERRQAAFTAAALRKTLERLSE